MSLDPEGSGPGEPSLAGLLRLAPELVGADPTTAAVRLRERYGHAVRVPGIHPAVEGTAYLLTHPEDVRTVLQREASSFRQLDAPGTRDFTSVVADSVVSLEPETGDPSDPWVRRTRLLTPEFSRDAVRRRVPRMAERTRATLAEFAHGGPPADSDAPDPARVRPGPDETVGDADEAAGTTLRLLPAARRLTLRLLGDTLFATDVRAHEVTVIDAVDRLRSLFAARQLQPLRSRLARELPSELGLPELPSALRLPEWLPAPSVAGGIDISDRGEAATERALRELTDVADSIAAARERAPLAHGDALATWLLRPDPVDGAPLSDDALRHEILGLLVAGHATTGVALTWALHELSGRPDLQDRIHEEARESLLLGSRAALAGDPRLDDLGLDEPGRSLQAALAEAEPLADLPLTRRVVDETLRLHPPLPFFGRTATAAVDLREVELEAGDHAVLSPYVTGRDPAFWSAPERFDPSRFEPDRAADRPAFAHYPFSAGPLACLGQSLATAELTTVLATVLATHRVEAVGGGGPHDPPPTGPDYAVNLQPDRDLLVRFVPRD